METFASPPRRTIYTGIFCGMGELNRLRRVYLNRRDAGKASKMRTWVCETGFEEFFHGSTNLTTTSGPLPVDGTRCPSTISRKQRAGFQLFSRVGRWEKQVAPGEIRQMSPDGACQISFTRREIREPIYPCDLQRIPSARCIPDFFRRSTNLTTTFPCAPA